MSAANKWSRAGRGSVQKWDHIRSKIWYRSRTALISTGIPRAGNEKIVAFCHIPGMSKEKRHGCELFLLPPTNLSPEGKDCCRSGRSEEHTSELQSLMRISYAVFCLKKQKKHNRLTKSTQLTTNKTQH